MMNANKDVIAGMMCRQLSNKAIGMREVVHSSTGVRGPNTHFLGQLAINGIWVLEEIEASSAAYLPCDPELGDHHPVVANTSNESLLGESGPRIKLPQSPNRIHPVCIQLVELFLGSRGTAPGVPHQNANLLVILLSEPSKLPQQRCSSTHLIIPKTKRSKPRTFRHIVNRCKHQIIT